MVTSQMIFFRRQFCDSQAGSEWVSTVRRCGFAYEASCCTLLSTTSSSGFHDVQRWSEWAGLDAGTTTCRIRSSAPAPCSSSQPSAIVLGRLTSPLDVTDDGVDVTNDADDDVVNVTSLSRFSTLFTATTSTLRWPTVSSSSPSSTSSAGSPSLPYDDHCRSITWLELGSHTTAHDWESCELYRQIARQ